MKKEVDKMRPDTVNMLLNVKMQTGKAEGRIGSFMITLLLIGAPIILFGSIILRLCLIFGTGLVLGISIPIYIWYIWRVVAKLLLHEKERLKEFKKKQISKYESVEDVTTIRRIHPDGAIEYSNNHISFFVICKNGNKADPIIRGAVIDKFLNVLSKYNVSIHVLNMIDSTPLSNRYNLISNYSNKKIAKNMFDMINYNKKYVEDNSLITHTIFEVNSLSQDRFIMRGLLEDSMNMLNGKTYREAVVADADLANKVLNRLMCTNVDFRSLFMKRYAKGQYYNNRILGYDLPIEIKQEKYVKTNNEVKGDEFPWMTKS